MVLIHFLMMFIFLTCGFAKVTANEFSSTPDDTDVPPAVPVNDTEVDFRGFALMPVAGLMVGCWAAPLRTIESRSPWKWNHVWMLYTPVFALVYPAIISLSSVNGLAESLHQLPNEVFWPIISLGFVFGVGNTMLGMIVPKLGLSLSVALNNSAFLIFGTLSPLFLTVDVFVTRRGATIIAASVVGGVSAFVALAAALKRDKFKETASVASPPASRGVLWGLAALMSGVMASMINLGFAIGEEDLLDLLHEKVEVSLWNSTIVWMVALWGASVSMFGMAVGYTFWSKSWDVCRLLRVGGRGEQHHLLHDEHETLNKPLSSVAVVFVSFIMGIFHFTGFWVYGLGSSMLGHLGPSAGFACFTSVAIITSVVVGALQGDWKGAGKVAQGLLCLSMVLLLTVVGMSAGSFFV